MIRQKFMVLHIGARTARRKLTWKMAECGFLMGKVAGFDAIRVLNVTFRLTDASLKDENGRGPHQNAAQGVALREYSKLVWRDGCAAVAKNDGPSRESL